MPVKHEDHEGIQIPVGDKFPTGESTIMPSKGGLGRQCEREQHGEWRGWK
jgi:hypothetical protein